MQILLFFMFIIAIRYNIIIDYTDNTNVTEITRIINLLPERMEVPIIF